MTFHHTHDDEKGLFTAQQDTQQAGEISYSQVDAHTLLIDHTQVDEAFQGHQLGKQLVDKVVAYARDNNFKIIPECPYAHHLFESSDAYNDVWEREG